jgi:hypothetical protein
MNSTSYSILGKNNRCLSIPICIDINDEATLGNVMQLGDLEISRWE